MLVGLVHVAKLNDIIGIVLCECGQDTPDPFHHLPPSVGVINEEGHHYNEDGS